MRTLTKLAVLVSAGALVLFGYSPLGRAGSHQWDVWEVFSNADGTVQFIELHETTGDNFETGLAGHIMVTHPTGLTYSIQNGVASPTGLKYFLLATAAFAALPGAPTPNEIIPPNFIHVATDTSVEYNPWDTGPWTLGTLPTDGIHSLQRQAVNGAMVSSVNSPTNYAGNTASIDASPAPPGVPDGSVRVNKVVADGSTLSVSFDTATCGDTNDHQILYGQRSSFPATPGGTYSLLGGACAIGTASPYTWSSTPSDSDGSGLIWFLVVSKKASGTEGPWGSYNGTTERTGPGTAGSSNVCSTTSKSIASVCGH